MRIALARILSLAILAIAFAGCSSGSMSPTQAVAGLEHGLHPRTTACPSGGIEFSPGNNGTYSVAVGDSCKLLGPPNEACVIGEQTGYSYSFVIASGGSNGTLSGTSQDGSNSVATFKRTSTGNVVIDLHQTYLNPANNCQGKGFTTYGSVTLTG